MSYDRQQLHRVGFVSELLASEDAIKSIRPLLRVSQDSILRLRHIESALIRSLERDPFLAERVLRLQTAPCVGRITALTWALEIGDISRFRSIRQAISYCGLCGDEQKSTHKTVRTPLSKKRNKHIQHVLVEAAKLAARYDPNLALLYAKEKQKGNANRATLTVARKILTYLLAVDREQRNFVPVEEFHVAAA